MPPSFLWGCAFPLPPESVYVERAFQATARFKVTGVAHAIGAMAADCAQRCFLYPVVQFAVWPAVWPVVGWRKQAFSRLFCFLFRFEYLCPCPCLWRQSLGDFLLCRRIGSLRKGLAPITVAKTAGAVAPEGATGGIAAEVVGAGHAGGVGGGGHALAGAEGEDGFEGGHGVTPLPFSWA